MRLNTKKKKAQQGKSISQQLWEMGNYVNSQSRAGISPDRTLAGWFGQINPTTQLIDNRKVRQSTGKPIRPNYDKKGGKFPTETVAQAIISAKKEGVDPYDMITLYLNESNLGIDDPVNLGRINPEIHNFDWNIIDPADYSARYFKKGMETYPQDSLLGAQYYNGLGKLGRSNDAGSHRLYGVDLPSGGLNTRQYPIYGINHYDIKHNVVKGNPAIEELIKKLEPYQPTYEPYQLDYLAAYEGDQSIQDEREYVEQGRKEWLQSVTNRPKTWQHGGTINTTGYLDNAPTRHNPYNIIPSNHITMDGVSQPIYANGQLLQPNSGDYIFNTPYVIEQPAMNKIKVKIKGFKANNGVTLHDKGELVPLSYNPYSGSTTDAIVGPTHAQDGVLMTINGELIEAEGGGHNKQGELINTNSDGSVTIFSKKTKVPGSKKSFADEVKGITRRENKLTKQLSKYGKKIDKATAMINQSDPYSPTEVAAFNTGSVNLDGALQRMQPIHAELQTLAEAKEGLAILQDMVNHDRKAIKAERGKTIAQQGVRVPGTNIVVNVGDQQNQNTTGTKAPKSQTGIYRDMASEAARRYGIHPVVFMRLVAQESGYNPKAKSTRGAQGIVQFIPETAKQYGVDGILGSDKPEDVAKVLDAGAQHFSKLVKQFDGDYNAALLAYNAGSGSKSGDKGYLAMRRWAANRLGKSPEEVTGSEVLQDLRTRRVKNPSKDKHAYHNESLDYVTSIMGYDPEDLDSDFSYPDFSRNVRALSSYGQTPAVPLYKSRDISEIEPLPVIGNQPFTQTPITPETLQPKGPAPAPNIVPIENPNPKSREMTSLADHNKVRLSELLPSIYAAVQQPDAVPHQSFTPTLYTPYTVSMQDQLNQVNSTYQTASRAAANNPALQYALAAQKYQADSQILGQQFRTNQQIQNQVTNQNVSLLNQAEAMNLQLQGQQIERQAKAVANTRAQRYQALANIANAYSQNRRDNANIRMMESMSGFRYNPATGKMEYQGEDAQFYAPTVGNDITKLSDVSKKVSKKKYGGRFK